MPPRTGPRRRTDLDHISIFDPSYQLPYSHKDDTFCCTHGNGTKRCKLIRSIDHYKSETSEVQRGHIAETLPSLLEQGPELGLDIFSLMCDWVEADLCLSHKCPATIREVQYEKLGEIGWSKVDIETRAAKMRVDTERGNPSRVGEGVYAVKKPGFGSHSMQDSTTPSDVPQSLPNEPAVNDEPGYNTSTGLLEWTRAWAEAARNSSQR